MAKLMRDMAKLIMWHLMTLDGFAEGPNRHIYWHLDVWGEQLERLSIDQVRPFRRCP